MTRATARRIWPLATALLSLAIAGCGDDRLGAMHTTAQRPPAGSQGTLAYAAPQLPSKLDPLTAPGATGRLISRQVYEPLVSSSAPPYGGRKRTRGLALGWKRSGDRSIWTFRLRPGVRFADRTPFNSAAVLANARRWQHTAAGRRLLPGLFAVDAPRPDEVRFLLRAPNPALPLELASPRLGIVSPQALGSRTGTATLRTDASGTGPFEATRLSSDRIVLARNAQWWGTPLGLGPALGGLDFKAVPSARARERGLRAGEFEVASGLGKAAAAALIHDSLVTALPGSGGSGLGLERSVRGITSPRAVIPYSGVWLTTIG